LKAYIREALGGKSGLEVKYKKTSEFNGVPGLKTHLLLTEAFFQNNWMQ
jgi:hypothetical protein